MVILKAEYVIMNGLIHRLKELCTGLENQIQTLRNSVTRMELSWSGQANAAFLYRMEQDFFTLALLQESMNQTVLLLLRAVQEYQKTESIIEQKIGGIRI